jgi:cob(I)alamin adenosyltransferase
MKIYTRTGDKGETSLFGGKRIAKSAIRVEAYGTIDELNSSIGVVLAEIQNTQRKTQNYNIKLKKALEKIQHDLFNIGAYLASPGSKHQEASIKKLGERVKELEEMIDELTEDLPELRNFILPAGGKIGSFLHLARTICRRAERRVVELAQKERVDEDTLRYLNRLSDLLFTTARFVNKKEKKKEKIWSSIVPFGDKRNEYKA